jgi:hypothetical protein
LKFHNCEDVFKVLIILSLIQTFSFRLKSSHIASHFFFCCCGIDRNFTSVGIRTEMSDIFKFRRFSCLVISPKKAENKLSSWIGQFMDMFWKISQRKQCDYFRTKTGRTLHRKIIHFLRIFCISQTEKAMWFL